MNDNNVEVKNSTVDNQNFANPLDKCGLQVSKSIKIDINFEEDKKKDGD